ncbi:unnamed protein product [Protopolystoma xenopodis]|uniref:Uncharacterized protein n=1 Tax=Protopolystoma xenopodis TaxID=117903 RepID=A0A3S5AZT9_9PLAT|nr:unnamed protein product [Protopolystoma xenopodis]
MEIMSSVDINHQLPQALFVVEGLGRLFLVRQFIPLPEEKKPPNQMVKHRRSASGLGGGGTGAGGASGGGKVRRRVQVPELTSNKFLMSMTGGGLHVNGQSGMMMTPAEKEALQVDSHHLGHAYHHSDPIHHHHHHPNELHQSGHEHGLAHSVAQAHQHSPCHHYGHHHHHSHQPPQRQLIGPSCHMHKHQLYGHMHPYPLAQQSDGFLQNLDCHGNSPFRNFIVPLVTSIETMYLT